MMGIDPAAIATQTDWDPKSDAIKIKPIKQKDKPTTAILCFMSQPLFCLILCKQDEAFFNYLPIRSSA
jgi:hypothetical protein